MDEQLARRALETLVRLYCLQHGEIVEEVIITKKDQEVKHE